MRGKGTTSFRLDPEWPPKADWRAFDAMTEKERHRAALSDPDSQPATREQLARARRVPDVRAVRRQLKMTQA